MGGNGLDIQHGKAVLDYTGLTDPMTLDPIANTLMQKALANGWVIDGTHPIGSTTAAVDPLVHALGWTDTVVGGRTVLTVMYTLCGDANLDGVVNGADLNTVLSNYNKTGMYWAQGDFNYDGTVNGARPQLGAVELQPVRERRRRRAGAVDSVAGGRGPGGAIGLRLAEAEVT